MKDKELFTVAGLAAIAGGILAYSIVTNDKVPVAPQLSPEQMLVEMSHAGPVDCVETAARMGNDTKDTIVWLCNGAYQKELSDYVASKAQAEKMYHVDFAPLPPAK